MGPTSRPKYSISSTHKPPWAPFQKRSTDFLQQRFILSLFVHKWIHIIRTFCGLFHFTLCLWDSPYCCMWFLFYLSFWVEFPHLFYRKKNGGLKISKNLPRPHSWSGTEARVTPRSLSTLLQTWGVLVVFLNPKTRICKPEQYYSFQIDLEAGSV